MGFNFCAAVKYFNKDTKTKRNKSEEIDVVGWFRIVGVGRGLTEITSG